ncbi:amidohydrolase family protein [Pigmentibacter sp. JX0631]|uniref:amidohydrolase family protein n=1 Tax=Pigmentibacter sp. JX0631 TaxID=2976982 RepID=UPI0024682DB7|nr:amidohydrolase family protein [Pigmentibacter sp. JX0631]WGL58702.1 amidohydrolase family protein [Pigmentibacter sp. JX0631]
MLIDFHVHLAGNGCCQSGIILGKKFERRPTFFLLKKMQKITKEQLLTDIDLLWINRIAKFIESSSHVSKAVTLCLDSIYTENGEELKEYIQMYIPNSWGKEVKTKFPHTLEFGASVHPYRKDSLQELEYCYKEKAFLIKWLPSMMGIDPENPLCLPFYEALRTFKIPLLSHTDTEHTFGLPVKEWNHYNHISKLKKALEMGVTVIAAHAGTPTQLSAAEELVNKYENFYLDTSGLFNPTRARSALKLFARAQNSLLRERLLFATDWPVPTIPHLIIDKLGIQAFRKLQQITNPFEKDLKIKEYLGFNANDFKKNQDSLLTLLDRSHSEINLT